MTLPCSDRSSILLRTPTIALLLLYHFVYSPRHSFSLDFLLVCIYIAHVSYSAMLIRVNTTVGHGLGSGSGRLSQPEIFTPLALPLGPQTREEIDQIYLNVPVNISDEAGGCRPPRTTSRN